MNWSKGTSWKFANNQKWPNAPWEYWMTAGHQNVCVQHWAYLQLVPTIVCLFFFLAFFPFLRLLPSHLHPPSIALPRQFSHHACSLRWHRGHSSYTRLPMIGHSVGRSANSEFIRDRWGRGVYVCMCVLVCASVRIGGFRQADYRSHTNIPT